MSASRCLAVLVVLLLGIAPPAAAADEPLMVFLVRHAEKVDSTDESPLTDHGRERAALLARTLRDAHIEHVHSSDYVRTRDTAAPAATLTRTEVQLYDAGDIPALVATLKATGGRHLVVGHSNTTPEAVKLLGGDPGAPIEESNDYDRLYVVTVGTDGAVSTVLLRFGRPPVGKP